MKWAFITLALLSEFLSCYLAYRGCEYMLWSLFFIICSVWGWGAAAYFSLKKQLKEIYTLKISTNFYDNTTTIHADKEDGE